MTSFKMYAWLYGYGRSEENCVRPQVSASAMFQTGHLPFTIQRYYCLSPHAVVCCHMMTIVCLSVLPGWNGETACRGDVVNLIFIAGNVEVSGPPYCCILYVDTLIIVPTS